MALLQPGDMFQMEEATVRGHEPVWYIVSSVSEETPHVYRCLNVNGGFFNNFTAKQIFEQGENLRRPEAITLVGRP